MKSKHWRQYGLVLVVMSILLPASGCAFDSSLIQILLNVVPLLLQGLTGGTGTTTP